MTHYTYGGIDHGAVNIWSMTPPSGQPGDPDRVLTYTVVYPEGSNQILSYQTTGIELLPNSTGGMERVQMSQVEFRNNYALLEEDGSSWPDNFFDVQSACYFGSNSKQGSDSKQGLTITAIIGAAFSLTILGLLLIPKMCRANRKAGYSIQANHSEED